jgi:hypothetical protein
VNQHAKIGVRAKRFAALRQETNNMYFTEIDVVDTLPERVPDQASGVIDKLQSELCKLGPGDLHKELERLWAYCVLRTCLRPDDWNAITNCRAWYGDLTITVWPGTDKRARDRIRRMAWGLQHDVWKVRIVNR